MQQRKTGSIKRFGPRYGRTVKNKLGAIEAIKRALSKCPYCSAIKVKRQANGIFECRKCLAKFTGRAYDTKIRKSISSAAGAGEQELLVKSKKHVKREARKEFEKEEIPEK